MNMKLTARSMAAIALAAFATGALAQQKTFTMKISTPSINDTTNEFMRVFKAGVEAKSGGRLKVDLYPASQLGPLPRTIEGVALGTIDMNFPATGFLVGLDPRYIVFDAPGLFDDEVQGYAVLRDPEMRKRFSNLGASQNIESLFFTFNGPLTVLSHKPIRVVDDLKGLRLRVPGGAPMHLEPFKKLGVTPLAMPPSEMLASLQNRGIDGATTALSVFTTFKYWDIAKAATELPGSYLMATAIVNRNTLKSYGPELEGLVRAEARKDEAIFTTWGFEDLERVRATWAKNGGEMNILSAAEKKRYVEEVSSVLPPLLAVNPKVKEDYDAIVATVRKYRK